MRLSVLSALARLDVDPWQEAANLAQLPKATAARRLASLIAKLPGLPLAQRDIAAAAARLIARLPRLAGSPVAATKTLLGAGVSVGWLRVPLVAGLWRPSFRAGAARRVMESRVRR